MTGIDTNVLIRYLVSDDPRQAEAAAAAIGKCTGQGEALVICGIVLAEVVWVLEGVYRMSKSDIVSVLDKLFSTAEFIVENRDIARQALEDFRDGKPDFADCMIGRTNQYLGCEKTLTFDRDLRFLETFDVL